MSEYQFIAFRAVDRPLSDAELRFAQRQSTRAEITRWSFTNEYHYGDFRGDAEGLLRSGYDVHLHYANYGVRRVALRLLQEAIGGKKGERMAREKAAELTKKYPTLTQLKGSLRKRGLLE